MPGYTNRRQAVEEAGGVVVRSGWEANICRLLVWLETRGEVVRWRYEPRRFYFTADVGVITTKGTPYQKGPYSYMPDFAVLWKGKAEEEEELWEIKGGRTHKGDRTRMARFRKHYPEAAARLRWIGPKEYRQLEKMWSRAVPGWTAAKRRTGSTGSGSRATTTRRRSRLSNTFTEEELLALASGSRPRS